MEKTVINNKGVPPPFKIDLNISLNRPLAVILTCWYLIMLQFDNLSLIIYLLKIFKDNVSVIYFYNIQRKQPVRWILLRIGASSWIFVIKLVSLALGKCCKVSKDFYLFFHFINMNKIGKKVEHIKIIICFKRKCFS